MRKAASVALAMVYGGVTAHLYRSYQPLDAQVLLLLAILPVSSVVLLYLSFRALSVDEAVGLRFTSSLAKYESTLQRRVILSNDGFAALVRMLIGTNIITAVPILWNKHSNSAFSSQVSTPLGYLFGTGSALVCIMSIVMSLTQPIMQVTFEQPEKKDDGFPTEIPDALPPIKVLAPYLARHAGIDGWHKVATTSRRHDIHAKVNKDADVYEIRTAWAEGHPSHSTSSNNNPSESKPIKGRLADLS